MARYSAVTTTGSRYRLPPTTTYKDDEGNTYTAYGQASNATVYFVIVPGFQLSFEPNPQDPRPFTQDELKGLRTQVSDVLRARKECMEFVSALLFTVAKNTQRPLYDSEFLSDPIKIFDAVANSPNGGFVLASNQGGAGRAWGGLATRNAKITLASIFQVGLVGLHEMMHEASGVGIEKYMDREFGLELI